MIKEKPKNIKNESPSIYSFLIHSMRFFNHVLETEFKNQQIGLNQQHYLILGEIINRDGIILEDLARLFTKDKSAILRHINYLQSIYCIAKMTDINDRRRKLLIPTKIGLELYGQAKIIEKGLTDKLTHGISEMNIAIFNGVLSEIRNQTLAKMKGATIKPI